MAGKGVGPAGEGKGGSDPAVAVELSEHGREIQEIKQVLHFQVSPLFLGNSYKKKKKSATESLVH